MDAEVLQAMRDLLERQRVLTLAVIVEGRPEAGLLPYALRADCAGVFVQASALARHTRGLTPGAEVGLLIHEPERPDLDPMQMMRLSVRGTVAVVDRNHPAYTGAAARFTDRFPGASVTLGLGDFNLYSLAFGSGRFVSGFGRAFNVGSHTFAELSHR